MHMQPHKSQVSTEYHLRAFPLAMFLGYLIPLMFAAIPAPILISYRAKQQLIGLWQGWPLYTTFIIGISRTTSHTNSSGYRQLRSACIFALACSTVGHFCLLGSSWSANISHHVYLPPSPWGKQASTLEAGILRFLQWDYTLSALAMLIWTSSRYLQGVDQPSRWRPIVSVIALVVVVILIGPCSVALLLFWKASSFSVENKT